MKSSSVWSVIILGVSLMAAVVEFAQVGGALSFALMLVFLCFCPGLMLTRFLRLREALVEWTLAITLSFVADVAVGVIAVLMGRWSPVAVVIILSLSTAVGVIVYEAEAFRAWWRAWA